MYYKDHANNEEDKENNIEVRQSPTVLFNLPFLYENYYR